MLIHTPATLFAAQLKAGRLNAPEFEVAGPRVSTSFDFSILTPD
jgi:hypothetical protein